MAETPQNQPNPTFQSSATPEELEELVRSLRRKEGNWVEWGQACATLQKSGYGSQQIFEETGFEPIQQNQVIVASQVYTSIVNGVASEETQSYFQRKGSDVLYEFRILTQPERVAAAEFVRSHNLDADEARELAKAMKDFSRLSSLPSGFTNHPGDAVAYQCWKAARQHQDLQQRSRLIARGLKYATSPTARQQIEQLLTDFTVVTQRSAPRLPVYRLETDEELPRVLPVVGQLPLTLEDLNAVPIIEEIEPFGIVKSSGHAAWVPIPGWQVIMNAEDPVVILTPSRLLPQALSGKAEDVLVVIDRAQRQWEVDKYFLVENAGHLELQWFEESPNLTLLGQVLLILRPKKVLDENHIRDVWQIDE